MLQAIAHLTRVDDRLLALLWCLAERWGRVVPDGVARVAAALAPHARRDGRRPPAVRDDRAGPAHGARRDRAPRRRRMDPARDAPEPRERRHAAWRGSSAPDAPRSITDPVLRGSMGHGRRPLIARTRRGAAAAPDAGAPACDRRRHALGDLAGDRAHPCRALRQGRHAGQDLRLGQPRRDGAARPAHGRRADARRRRTASTRCARCARRSSSAMEPTFRVAVEQLTGRRVCRSCRRSTRSTASASRSSCSSRSATAATTTGPAPPERRAGQALARKRSIRRLLDVRGRRGRRRPAPPRGRRGRSPLRSAGARARDPRRGRSIARRRAGRRRGAAR